MEDIRLNMENQFWELDSNEIFKWDSGDHLYAENFGAENNFGNHSVEPSFETARPNYSLKRCQGFVRCDMDIDAEVVGWVIGKNGVAIKDLKNKTGCNMWVDQRALKLTITGPDFHIVEHAARSVQAYVAAAPIKAGAAEAAVTKTLDCPPHLLDILGEKSMIAKIVKETRAQVVVNKKMGRAIIRGRAHPVQMASKKVMEILSSAAAEHPKEKHNSNPSIRAKNKLTLPDHDHNISTSMSNYPLRSPTDSFEAVDSPFNLSNRNWSLFSGPAAFSASSVAPICGTPQSSINRSARSNTKFFASSPTNEDSGNIASTTTSPLPFVKSDMRKQPMSGASKSTDSSDTDYDSILSLLESLKLEKYNRKFEENEVDIDAIRLMNEADFKEMGIPKGPILKIMNAVCTVTPRTF